MKPVKNNNKWLFSRLKIVKSYDPWILFILGLSFLLIIVISLVSTQFGSLFTVVRSSDFKAGSVAERDFVVERDILYTDQEATRLKEEAAEKLVLPVFRINEEISERSLTRFNQFQQFFTQLIQDETPLDTVYLKVQLTFPGIFTRGMVAELYNSPVFEGVFRRGKVLLEGILQNGIISLPEQTLELFSAGGIEVWRWREGKLEKEEYPLAEVTTLSVLDQWMAGKLAYLPEESIPTIVSLVKAFAMENGFIDMDQTTKHRQRAREAVEPVMAKLVAGQIVVRRGDIISEAEAAQIKAVGEYSVSVNLLSIAGTVLLVGVVFSFSIYIFSRKILKLQLNRGQVLFLAAIGLFYLGYAAVFSKFFEPPGGLPLAVILPTAAVSILVTLIISTNAGFIFSIIISLLVLPIIKLDVHSFLVAMLTGIAGTAVVINAEKRIDLIRAGVYLSALNWLILFSLNLLGDRQSGTLFLILGWGILNGLLSSLVGVGFLPVLEHWLNASTRFRLRELADPNAPILKRMLSLAPGTYSHSMSVANLAESACSGIKANALLARVGAYYHDIGKIDQAEYFIENQRSFNKHDELKPSLSAAVIKSHVKMGIEKAKEMNLPPEVIDIIAQHHGGGIIKYFYQRALENEQKANVKSEDYSYPGARPRSKETAVVLLADAVEAASRTLKKPTIAKLEKFVGNVIMDKLTSGELDDCDLTLKDLETIKKSFVQILAGYFHSRIEYPKVVEAVR